MSPRTGEGVHDAESAYLGTVVIVTPNILCCASKCKDAGKVFSNMLYSDVLQNISYI